MNLTIVEYHASKDLELITTHYLYQCDIATLVEHCGYFARECAELMFREDVETPFQFAESAGVGVKAFLQFIYKKEMPQCEHLKEMLLLAHKWQLKTTSSFYTDLLVELESVDLILIRPFFPEDLSILPMMMQKFLSFRIVDMVCEFYNPPQDNPGEDNDDKLETWKYIAKEYHSLLDCTMKMYKLLDSDTLERIVKKRVFNYCKTGLSTDTLFNWTIFKNVLKVPRVFSLAQDIKKKLSITITPTTIPICTSLSCDSPILHYYQPSSPILSPEKNLEGLENDILWSLK